LSFDLKDDKVSQTDFIDKELLALKEKLSNSELIEAAYNEELSNRNDDIIKLSNEIVSLKETIDELLTNSSKNKLGRQDSSLEFEALKDINKGSLLLLDNCDEASETIQQDLMSELHSYEEKLLEKDKEILEIDKQLKDKEQKIEKLQHILNFNSQFLIEIQNMNKMIEKKTKGGISNSAPSREESLNQQFNESLEPETFQDFTQVQAVQRLKENIGQILKDSLKVKDNKIGEENLDVIDGNVSPVIMEKKSQLKLQEERIKQAFLENQEAEKETQIKLQSDWEDDKDKANNNDNTIPRADKMVLLETGVDNLSQQIVDSLISTLSLESNSDEDKLTSPKKKAFTDEVSDGEVLAQKNMEIKKLQDNLKFQKQQDKYHIEELQSAVQQERSQTLNMMGKLNEEKQSKSELQEDVFMLRDEVCDLQTQLVRHKDEIEELTSLYEAEKLQTLVLEEALVAEKENFNKLTKSLNEERKRSQEASARDSDTIMELRTALEIEKEKEARLGMESPYPGGLKSHKGSKQSLHGSRQSLSHGQNQDKIYEDLLQERNRCDRLRECLEMEREKNAKLADTSEGEVSELLEQIRERDEESEAMRKRIETMEMEKCQLIREVEHNNERIERLEKNKLMSENRNVKAEIKVNGELYVKDLEAQVESLKEKEEMLLEQMEKLKSRGNNENYPIIKSSSFGGAFKNVPEDPQDQSIFFFRKLLRAESYRKALIWQKRYLSLLIFSYQESELLSLGRLARMSGGRKMLIADIPSPEGRNVHFRVAVHAIISISRMKFLVRRWKKTKKSSRKAWSQDPTGALARRITEDTRHSTEEIEKPGLSFV